VSQLNSLWADLRAGIDERAGVFVVPTGALTNGATGLPVTEEESMRGWTVQQPYEHRHYPVKVHLCALCGGAVDPDKLTGHDCRVRAAVA
jgi:hypothetical protein